MNYAVTCGRCRRANFLTDDAIDRALEIEDGKIACLWCGNAIDPDDAPGLLEPVNPSEGLTEDEIAIES